MNPSIQQLAEAGTREGYWVLRPIVELVERQFGIRLEPNGQHHSGRVLRPWQDDGSAWTYYADHEEGQLRSALLAFETNQFRIRVVLSLEMYLDYQDSVLDRMRRTASTIEKMVQEELGVGRLSTEETGPGRPTTMGTTVVTISSVLDPLPAPRRSLAAPVECLTEADTDSLLDNLERHLTTAYTDYKWSTGHCANLAYGIQKFLAKHGMNVDVVTDRHRDPKGGWYWGHNHAFARIKNSGRGFDSQAGTAMVKQLTDPANFSAEFGPWEFVPASLEDITSPGVGRDDGIRVSSRMVNKVVKDLELHVQP